MSKPHVKKTHKHQCPRCRRKLVKVSIKGGLPFLPKKGTLTFWKCRVCQYREAYSGKSLKVITQPGGAIAK